RRVRHEARAAAFTVGETEQAPRHPDIDAFSSGHPEEGEPALARENAPLGRGEGLRHIAALVLQVVAQVLIGGEAEKMTAAAWLRRKLEVGEIGATVGPAQPVLLLGEIVVAEACG